MLASAVASKGFRSYSCWEEEDHETDKIRNVEHSPSTNLSEGEKILNSKIAKGAKKEVTAPTEAPEATFHGSPLLKQCRLRRSLNSKAEASLFGSSTVSMGIWSWMEKIRKKQVGNTNLFAPRTHVPAFVHITYPRSSIIPPINVLSLR